MLRDIAMPLPDASGGSSLADQLRQYILHELTAMPERPLADDAPLFESLLDSTSVLALVSFLEQSFHIEVGDNEIVPANFSTLRRLCAFVERKTQPTPLAANG